MKESLEPVLERLRMTLGSLDDGQIELLGGPRQLEETPHDDQELGTFTAPELAERLEMKLPALHQLLEAGVLTRTIRPRPEASAGSTPQRYQRTPTAPATAKTPARSQPSASVDRGPRGGLSNRRVWRALEYRVQRQAERALSPNLVALPFNGREASASLARATAHRSSCGGLDRPLKHECKGPLSAPCGCVTRELRVAGSAGEHMAAGPVRSAFECSAAALGAVSVRLEASATRPVSGAGRRLTGVGLWRPVAHAGAYRGTAAGGRNVREPLYGPRLT